MTEQAAEPNGITLERFRNVWRRLDEIEKTNPAAMAEQLKGLREDVQAIKRGVYGIAFGVPIASLVFAFTVFQVIGGHS